MKLIQLNAWGGRLTHTLEKFLETEQPDILCLQEAIELENNRGALYITVDEIKQIIGAEYLYMSPAFSLNYMQRVAHFGNCIIAKFPIIHKETIFTGRGYVDNFDWTKHTQNIRNLQYVTLDIPGSQPLHIFNHHGHHVHEHKNGDKESMRQCMLIAEHIKKVKKGKVVVTGDFNLLPDSLALQQINRIIPNLSKKYGLDTTRTTLTNKVGVCDYIFANSEIDIISFKAADDLVSDHKALILEFN